ncbi:MAG: biotin/lipoyl-binding protein [Rubrivivax sp.]
MRLHFHDAPDEPHLVRALPGRDAVAVDGQPVAVQALDGGGFAVMLDGRPERVHAAAQGDEVWLHLRGRSWRLQRADAARPPAGRGAGERGSLQAAMPGVVVSLLVAPGQAVDEGQALLVIESMKLQTTVGAPAAGTVAELPLAVGQSFQRGALLARLADEGAA